MKKRVNDFNEDAVMCNCRQRPVTNRWPGGFCEVCGRAYYVRIWTWVCEGCDTYIDSRYPEDVDRLGHAVYQLSQLGEKIPVKAARKLKQLGIEVTDLIRKYGGVA